MIRIRRVPDDLTPANAAAIAQVQTILRAQFPEARPIESAGIPELLRKKFESARDRFRGIPFVLKRVYVTRMESEIAEHLHDLLAEFPELHLGSYPRIQEESFRVLLTLESRDAGYVQRALDSLLGRLPDGAVRRVE